MTENLLDVSQRNSRTPNGEKTMSSLGGKKKSNLWESVIQLFEKQLGYL